ncbi:MAG: hypothetical protein A3K45_07365 [Chloroflexi bacterium RIFOXYC12_FULL_59_14]|nr:MAG: hypothetical protein A3K45_07365 [Chloroflexi bacterium RIFOXYC12_FULL_59_14]
MNRKEFDAESYTVFLKEKSTEDFKVAELMLRWQSMGYCLFWTHAALQKSFAAIICKETQKRPPWRGDLTKLARLAKVSLTSEQREFFKVLNFYHKEGLYLGLVYPEPSRKETRKHLLTAKKMAASLSNPLAE